MLKIDWMCCNCEHMNTIIDDTSKHIEAGGELEYSSTCRNCGKKHSVYLVQDDCIREKLDGEE